MVESGAKRFDLGVDRLGFCLESALNEGEVDVNNYCTTQFSGQHQQELYGQNTLIRNILLL